MKRSSTTRRIQCPRLREAGLRLSGLLTRGGGEFFGEQHGVGIEAMESVEKIRSAEGEANAGDVLLDEQARFGKGFQDPKLAGILPRDLKDFEGKCGVFESQ